MADWNNDNPNTLSMSFDLKPDRQAIEFFTNMMNDFKSNEEAIGKRIEQLFDEFFGGDSEEHREERELALRLFSLGYQLGWNDHYELMKEKEE